MILILESGGIFLSSDAMFDPWDRQAVIRSQVTIKSFIFLLKYPEKNTTFMLKSIQYVHDRKRHTTIGWPHPDRGELHGLSDRQDQSDFESGNPSGCSGRCSEDCSNNCNLEEHVFWQVVKYYHLIFELSTDLINSGYFC